MSFEIFDLVQLIDLDLNTKIHKIVLIKNNKKKTAIINNLYLKNVVKVLDNLKLKCSTCSSIELFWMDNKKERNLIIKY